MLKTFLRALILMTQVSLYLFSFLELIWNCVFQQLPRWLKVIGNLDSSEACGPDFLPVALKNCGSELSYILAELFNKCLKEFYFPDCWKILSVIPVFKNIGERFVARICSPFSLLWLIKSLKNINNKIVDHLEKCGLFSEFQYGFRSSRSTADLLAVVSDRIARFLTGLGLLK